jgi:hypothetical protein
VNGGSTAGLASLAGENQLGSTTGAIGLRVVDETACSGTTSLYGGIVSLPTSRELTAGRLDARSDVSVTAGILVTVIDNTIAAILGGSCVKRGKSTARKVFVTILIVKLGRTQNDG